MEPHRERFGMERFDTDDLGDRLRESDELYREFIRTDAMSVGLYRLPAGSDDPQEPHTEDEVYHVVDGRAKLRVGEEVRPVGPGDVVFVERGVEHAFLDIEADLVTLVFFAPAEGTSEGSRTAESSD